MRREWVWLVLFVMGCEGSGEGGTDPTGAPPPTDPDPNGPVDADGDGFDEDEDCDDGDDTIYPGAPDTPYDGIDSDCAGDSDFDADGDGFDSDQHTGTDCNDSDDQVFPGAAEACDGVDRDCDGTIDSPAPEDAPIWYLDNDDDTYGDPDQSVQACAAPADHVADNTDCNDADGATYPSAPTVTCDGSDNDCDPTTQETPGAVAIGGDSYPTLQDALAAANNGDVIEICEGLHSVTGVDVTSALEIQGRFTAPVTRIAPTDVETVLTVSTSDPVTLTRVTLTGGQGTEVGLRRHGGGVLLGPNSDLRLVDAIIEANEADLGGGIYADDGSSITMSGSTLALNEAAFGGGAIHVLRDVVIEGNGTTTVTGNDGGLAGGGLDASFGVEVSGVDFVGNEAVSAGAIYGQDLRVTDCRIQSNFGSNSNGGVVTLGNNLFTRVTFENNLGGVDVGAMEVNGGTVELVDCTVQNNGVGSSLGDVGGVQLFNAVLISTNTDWGMAPNDNLPNDIELLATGSFWNVDGVSSFTCDDVNGGCQ